MAVMMIKPVFLDINRTAFIDGPLSRCPAVTGEQPVGHGFEVISLNFSVKRHAIALTTGQGPANIVSGIPKTLKLTGIMCID
jgi:hypothetical protein